MSKLSKKIEVDEFILDLPNDRIAAFVIVDDQEDYTEFSINQQEFETFCDQYDLREYEVNIPGNDTAPERDVVCSLSWVDIYDGREEMYKFLKAYITNLYDMEAMNIEAPLKHILSTHKSIAI